MASQSYDVALQSPSLLKSSKRKTKDDVDKHPHEDSLVNSVPQVMLLKLPPSSPSDGGKCNGNDYGNITHKLIRQREIKI